MDTNNGSKIGTRLDGTQSGRPDSDTMINPNCKQQPCYDRDGPLPPMVHEAEYVAREKAHR